MNLKENGFSTLYVGQTGAKRLMPSNEIIDSVDMEHGSLHVEYVTQMLVVCHIEERQDNDCSFQGFVQSIAAALLEVIRPDISSQIENQ